jgi:hypothetical protein
MEWLLVGFVLGALVMFAFTRHHATQVELYKRLYEEATKGVVSHLHDAITIDGARHIVARAEAEALDEEEPPPPPPPVKKLVPSGTDFQCQECDQVVKWGASECRACETPYSYAGGVARRR